MIISEKFHHCILKKTSLYFPKSIMMFSGKYNDVFLDSQLTI